MSYNKGHFVKDTQQQAYFWEINICEGSDKVLLLL